MNIKDKLTNIKEKIIRLLNSPYKLFIIFQITIVIIFGGAYFWNFAKFVKCDFVSPYKCEVVHGIGLVPPLQIITVWFDHD